jgi:hypothetical protein
MLYAGLIKKNPSLSSIQKPVSRIQVKEVFDMSDWGPKIFSFFATGVVAERWNKRAGAKAVELEKVS